MEFLEYFRYWKCLKCGQPYFGLVMASAQGDPLRHKAMQALVQAECLSRSDPASGYRILEIGSWAGGSAINFADAIVKYNARRGRVFCIDPWKKYIRPEWGGRIYRIMDRSLETEAIIGLFLHNVRSSGYEDIIRVMRGGSEEMLPLLKNDQFDLIYVDGDHRYEYILKDFHLAGRLIRDGGILCGDDLELQYPEIDEANARQNAASDYVMDPGTNKFFHPGVTLAVAEFFGEVSAWDGFWAMQRRGEGWEKIRIEASDLENQRPPAFLT